MPHDQVFKELLHAFLREFMQLFFPDVAARLDFNSVEFPDREFFTDVPAGSRREPDVVAIVNTLDGQPEIIVVHIEVQAKRAGDVGYRMFEYYALLRLRFKQPVFPAVLYLAPGVGGLTEAIYNETLFRREILRFCYAVIGLPDLSADDYADNENPLAPALSALMRRSRLGGLVQKWRTFLQTATSGENEARKALLLHVIETYLKLSEQEEAEFQRRLAEQEPAEVREMLTIWEERGMEKGMEKGMQKGIEQGMAQGVARGKRDTLLRQLRLKFGELPASVVQKVETMQTTEELDALSERILTANSLEEMGLSESGTPPNP